MAASSATAPWAGTVSRRRKRRYSRGTCATGCRSSARSTPRAGCWAAPGARRAAICAWKRASTARSSTACCRLGTTSRCWRSLIRTSWAMPGRWRCIRMERAKALMTRAQTAAPQGRRFRVTIRRRRNGISRLHSAAVRDIVPSARARSLASTQGSLGEQIDDPSFLFLRCGGICGSRHGDRSGASASSHLGDRQERARLRARRYRDGLAPRLDLRRHVLGVRDPRDRIEDEGRVHPRRVGAARGGQRHLAQGIRFLHLCQGERKEDRVQRAAGGLLSRLQSQGYGAYALLHAAAEDAGESEGPDARSLRPGILRRLQLRRKGSRQARGRARTLQALDRAAAGNGRRTGATTKPTPCRPERSVAHHWCRIREQYRSEMSVKIVGRRPVVQIVLLVTVSAGLLFAAGVFDGAFAQAGPFGAPRSQAPAPPVGGVLGWIFAKQAEFYRQFASLLRAAKADGSAAWSLFGLSFLYGIFHAAGPGHGKAVISSYIVAYNETWMLGVVLSFASALLQALVAVAVVGLAAALLNATAATMGRAVNVIEIVSYSLIIVIGVRLLWVKGRAFLALLHTLHRPAAVGAAVTPRPHDHAHHGHAHDSHAHNGHDHSHGHGHDHGHHHHGEGHAHHHHADDEDASAWGHAHAPEPEELAGPGGWKRGLSAIVAVGLRPCSGAILVLVFALAQGLFWAGVASPFVMGIGTAITVAVIASIAVGARAWAQHFADARSGYGMLVMRGVEVGAAVVIIAFGALLLTGYMVTERMVGI